MVLAAAGATTGCSTALPDEALRPWLNPDAESDPRRFMLAHALLAHPELPRSAQAFSFARVKKPRANLKARGMRPSDANGLFALWSVLPGWRGLAMLSRMFSALLNTRTPQHE